MQKMQLDIPILLPDVQDERDACVKRLINILEDRKGIVKVHIKKNGDGKPQLCIHFEPSQLSLARIKELALSTGAQLTEKYQHMVRDVSGIRHARQARQVERELREIPGVVEARVGVSGRIVVEFDTQLADTGQLDTRLHRLKLMPRKKAETINEKDHAHPYQRLFGANTELIFSISCGVFLVTGFVLSYFSIFPPVVSLIFYLGAYFFGGFYTLKEAVEKLGKGIFEIDFLMLVAAIGAAILGAWTEGAFLLFLFSMGHALEHHAMDRARKSIAALSDLGAKRALVRRDGGMEEIDVEQLQINDVVIVRPNSKIPSDGVVVQGAGSVDQSPITGESIPVDKKAMDKPGKGAQSFNQLPAIHQVFAGTINGANTLEIKVLKETKDSTLSRLIRLVQEAEAQKSPTQRFTDRFEKYYVPAVLLLVFLLNFACLVIDESFQQSFYRAMAVLVAASPCALAISTPSAVLSGIARAAKGGVLIKGGRPLEDLGVLRAIAFDKTGTLTQGKPVLTGFYSLDGDEQQLLSIAWAVERLSDHPLAQAITRGAEEQLDVQQIPEARNLEAVTGRGVKATWKGEPVFIGNQEFFLENGGIPEALIVQAEGFEAEGNTTMLVQRNKQFLGILTVRDEPRPEAKQVLSRLKELGIRRMVMISGDDQRVAAAIGKEVGLTDTFGNLLPEEKVTTIKKLKATEEKVAMVGDGVNDAPAMASSTVGIAMGAAGSDVALETADIALMADNLHNLPFAIGLSRKARRIITQNLWISLGMIAILVPLTITGVASMGPAVVFHEGSTIVVVLNALRLLGYKE